MITAKIWNRFFLTGSILIILLFFLLNVYTPLIADDYSLSLGINSLSDIFASQYNYYFNWSGRSIVLFTAQFWLLAGKLFFNIANTIVYCAFILLVQFHITGNIKKDQYWIFLTLNIFFWFFVSAWGQCFLWLTGSCVYLWVAVIILFFLVPFRKKQDNPEYKLNLPLSFLFFFAGILAGWSNENSGAAVLFLLLAYFIIKIKNRNKFNLFEILGAIGFLIGFFLLIAAPGNYVRAEIIRQPESGFYSRSFVLMLILNFFSVTKVFINNYGFLLIFISIVFGFDILYHQKRKLNMFSYFYTLAALAGVYSMVVIPYFPDRAFLIVTVFSVIALGNILLQMDLQIPNIIKRNINVIAGVILIFLSVSFLNVSKQVIGVYLRWYDRIEYIFAEKEKGNLEIEANIIIATDKHVASYELEDISYNKYNWTNTSIAQYFNITSIKANDKEPLSESAWLDKRKRIRQLLTPWKLETYRQLTGTCNLTVRIK